MLLRVASVLVLPLSILFDKYTPLFVSVLIVSPFTVIFESLSEMTVVLDAYVNGILENMHSNTKIEIIKNFFILSSLCFLLI